MQIVNDLVGTIQIIAISVIAILAILGALGFYFYKSKRKMKTEETADSSSFNRKDILDYLKIDDVADSMLVVNGRTRFIGAIKCQGFSFADAEVEEKLQTIRGYITFFNVLDNCPVQFRQSARNVNLEGLIHAYQDRVTVLEEKRFTLNLDYTDLKAESENPELTKAEYDIYYDKLKQMQRELVSLGYQIEQLNAQIQYMAAISGDNAEAKREEIYVFDWEYNAMDFSSQSLNEQEVYLRAETQLKTKASAYISALRNCGVHAKRMTGVELLEEIRRYTHPVTAANGTADDILRSAYDSICVTSNSLNELEKEANAKIVHEIAEEMMKGVE